MVPPLRASDHIHSLTEDVARLPLTARIERAQWYRARSASKKGTWLCPPPSLLQKQSHRHLLSLDPGPAERLDDLAGQYFRHFYQ